MLLISDEIQFDSVAIKDHVGLTVLIVGLTEGLRWKRDTESIRSCF